MGVKKKTSFKEELRRSLLNQAIIPFACSVFLLFIAFMGIGFQIIFQKNHEERKIFSEKYVNIMETYVSKIDEISEELSIARFKQDKKYRVLQMEKLYHFLNEQQARGKFYLYDKNFQLIYKISEEDVSEEYLLPYLKLKKNDELFWKKTEFVYDNWKLYKNAFTFNVMFRELKNKEDVEGYVGFVVGLEDFKKEQKNQSPTIVVTNKYYRVFFSDAFEFSDERGKIYKELRNDGLIKLDRDWYYVSSSSVINDEVCIYSISDCTVFFQLIFISLLIVIFMSILMITFIYFRAGKIAKKKTDIMYELIDAIKEVEKENLDIRVNIQSGDEFEKMGRTFNRMLDSIQELMESQRQLTEENVIATIQSLEAQFNPHFLFNSLESIRYMIEINKKDAEKMVVNMSRLLRYSIQRTEKLVTMREEINFADKYLELMKYRFGNQLQYQIQADENLYDISIPRMLIQPIVENSVKYGYGVKEVLNIYITTRKGNHCIEIIIEDDGDGIEEDLLEKICESLNCNQNYSGHIGIHNVHRRLYLMYGSQYGIKLESKKTLGTKVVLIIPNKME